jgi:CrcB protein
MKMILYIALGAVGRYLVATQAVRFFGPQLPIGTFFVNVLGSFVLGILVELLPIRNTVTPEVRAFLALGVLGSFTTFSAFSLDVSLMIECNEWLEAVTYVIASVLLCVGALLAGLWVSRTYLL